MFRVEHDWKWKSKKFRTKKRGELIKAVTEASGDDGCRNLAKQMLEVELTYLREKKDASEFDHQVCVVLWLHANLAPYGIKFTASANGEPRHILVAKKLKLMGVSRGYPDLTIPLPRKPYHGLYIELKRASAGKVTQEQIEWMAYLNSVGYRAEVARGYDKAIGIIEDYMKGEPW